MRAWASSTGTWEHLSNQAIAAAGVVYFLALVAHLVEWSALRTVPVKAAARAVVPATAGGSPRGDSDAPPADPGAAGRVAPATASRCSATSR